MPIEEKQISETQRLINIMKLETRLFKLIEIELELSPCEAKDMLTQKINSIQSEYSRISL